MWLEFRNQEGSVKGQGVTHSGADWGRVEFCFDHTWLSLGHKSMIMICIDSESTIKLIRVKASTVYCYGHWITRPLYGALSRRCSSWTIIIMAAALAVTGKVQVDSESKADLNSVYHLTGTAFMNNILLISDAMRRSVTKATITPAEWHHAWPLPVLAAMHMAPFQNFYNQSHFIALFSSNFILLRAIFVITFGRGTHTGTIISVLHFKFAYSANNFSI